MKIIRNKRINNEPVQIIIFMIFFNDCFKAFVGIIDFVGYVCTPVIISIINYPYLCSTERLGQARLVLPQLSYNF